MATYLSNPYSGVRLVFIVPYGDGVGNAATGGVAPVAFNNLDNYLKYGQASGPALAWSMDNIISLGGKWFEHLWMYGQGPGYTIGTSGSDYPGGSTTIGCTMWNQVNHAAFAGTGSYISQIVTALDTSGRRGSLYGMYIYSGGVAASSASDNATLDAHAAVAVALGAAQEYDSQSVLDYANATNPHKKHVDRQASLGHEVWGESWELRNVASVSGWLTKEAGIMALTSSSVPINTATRAGLAITNPTGWYTLQSVPAGVRGSVLIQNDGGAPEQRTAVTQFWLQSGYDVRIDVGGFSNAQITALINYWLGLVQVSGGGGGSGSSDQSIRVGGGNTRSKIISLVNCLDPLVGTGDENYMHGAVTPGLWSGGWPQFFTDKGLAHQWSDLGVSRFLLYAPFGIYPSTALKTVGYTAAQAAVTSNVLGPRQSETDLSDARLVAGLAGGTGVTLPSFIDFWQGITADFASQAGEIICYQGVPPVTSAYDPMTVDNWVREAETCGMSLGLDSTGMVDRLSYPTAGSVLADRLYVRGRKTSATTHAAVDPRVNGWFDGRFSVISTKAQADAAFATPASYNVPNLGRDSVVLLTAAVTPDPATRVQLALQWLGRVTRASVWTAAVEMGDMSDQQIVALTNAGG